jgi:cytidine deaminase
MLPTLEAPELVFGLCAPLGTDIEKVKDILVKYLLSYSYKPISFKVTDLMSQIQMPGMALDLSTTKVKYDSYIKYANKIRELYDDSSVLSALCCTRIRSYRRNERKKNASIGDDERKQPYLPSTAYIFHQFKRKEEVDLLRQMDGRLFIFISVYSDKDLRTRDLAQKLAVDESRARTTRRHEFEAKELLNRDEEEEGLPTGQRFRDLFPHADLFVNIDDLEETERAIDRFLRSYFGANNISPTRDEYEMYIAKTASLRSLDLSRQVGAAIFSEQGEVISLGCNEVPKANGGTYWSGDIDDARDYTRGIDENELIKRAILADVVRRLVEGEFVSKENKEMDLVEYIMDESRKRGSLLREALVMDLLEFGRAIHAEMSALMDAARLGRDVKGAILYCTTFPCHICAKHIIAAGIKKVVYIEPYPKSFAEQLHDEIVIKAGKYTGKKIQFSPFLGISPFRFRDIFERGRRKDDGGRFRPWIDNAPRVIVKYPSAAYLGNEWSVVKRFFGKTKILKGANKARIKGT